MHAAAASEALGRAVEEDSDEELAEVILCVAAALEAVLFR
ncbi:hypothetical protein BH11ACT6_BH11ACT6_53500 [soil metagenome]